MIPRLLKGFDCKPTASIWAAFTKVSPDIVLPSITDLAGLCASVSVQAEVLNFCPLDPFEIAEVERQQLGLRGDIELAVDVAAVDLNGAGGNAEPQADRL